jgi:hypothetical protein
MELSFAKTSEKEMEKILATVPQPGQTKEAVKQIIALMERDARRAAKELGQNNWAETPQTIAERFPQEYVEDALAGYSAATQRLTRTQKLGKGILQGDDELIAEGLSGARGAVAPQEPRPHGWAPNIATPTTPGSKPRVSWEAYK